MQGSRLRTCILVALGPSGWTWGLQDIGSIHGPGPSDQDPCSPRVTLTRHRSLRKSLRDRGQLSHFWKAHKLDMVQYSEDCAAFTETNEPLINYLDVSVVALRAGGVLSPSSMPQTPRKDIS